MNVTTVKHTDTISEGTYDVDVATMAVRIRERRRALRLSQEALARALEVSKNTVARWEAGGGVEQQNLIALAELLGVSMEWLMRGESSEHTSPPQSPDPAHWPEFTANYPHIGELTDEDLDDIKAFAARRGAQVDSWMRWAEIAEWVRRAKPLTELEEE